MSKKSDLKRAIGDTEREIEALEKKRERSQSALLQAMLVGDKPNKDDLEFFRVFTSLINEARENLRKLMKELDSLK